MRDGSQGNRSGLLTWGTLLEVILKLQDPGRVEPLLTAAGSQYRSLGSPPSLSHLPVTTSLLPPGITQKQSTATATPRGTDAKMLSIKDCPKYTTCLDSPRPHATWNRSPFSGTPFSRASAVSVQSFPTDSGTTWQALSSAALEMSLGDGVTWSLQQGSSMDRTNSRGKSSMCVQGAANHSRQNTKRQSREPRG